MAGRRPRAGSRAPEPELREQLAHEAARLMIEHGIEDFGLAKRKAAERFGVRTPGALPSNSQIEACVVERQRLFEPDALDERLIKLRRLAVEVMSWLEPFRPKLVGAVLAGTATINSSVELHAFSDSPELIVAALEQNGIAPRDCQRRQRFGREQVEQIPGYTFFCDGEEIEVLVFNERGAHHAPLSPIDQKPMRRASLGAVLALLDESNAY